MRAIWRMVLTANQIVYTPDELEAQYGRFVDSVEVNQVDLGNSLCRPKASRDRLRLS